ncbi:glycosyltransferase family 2 protein [uncultured Sphingomonas sp.]|uniref:glycosyltransferase family 2 protein n=1 Tax=uncultured Sphingomonas sp. TaxID=158754 RepID=UPI0025DAFD33|nr:glycosyltransferase family 2 protein [uncultured Sphingomonas sp.]
MTNIAIVIVNYRTPGLVKECLASVARERAPGLTLKVYVGDADSGDGSTGIIRDYIAEAGLDFCTCFDIGVNGGFAYGNNHILEQHVLGDPGIDYVYFLNPDTYVRAGAIQALLTTLREHPKAGVAGSRLENPDGSPRAYGFRFPAPWREFFGGARLGVADRLVPSASVKIENLEETGQVDWVTGASFMMPRPVLDVVGLMDARYFLYFEEVDLMARVRAAGYEIWHVADSRVVHLAGQSTGVRSDEKLKRVPAYWYESRYKFFHDRYGKGQAVLANMLFLTGDLVYRAHRTARGKQILDAPFLWRDMIAHGFSLPKARGAR